MMIINKHQFKMTKLTSAKKAFDLVRMLKKEDRFEFVLKCRENDGTFAYYIFYYNLIVK